MPRYKLTIEYDGTPFVGWQMQDNGASVQGRLAEAIKAFSGEDVIPRGAGRTDAGVHALGQVAHFDLAKDWADRQGARCAQRAVSARSDQRARLRDASPTISTRVSRRPRVIISIASSTGAARSALDRDRAWQVVRTARCRGHARGGAGASSATTTSPPSARPMPGGVAR